MCRRWSLALLGVCLISYQVFAAEARVVNVTGELIRRGDDRVCVLTVANTDNVDALGGVWVTLVNAGVEQFRVGPIDLAPKQSVGVSNRVERGTVCRGADVFYLVTFQRAGLANETIISPNYGPENSTWSPATSTIVGGIIGFISAIAGTWVTHYLTVVRERRSAQRGKFHATETVFNSFFVNWAGSIVPQELQTHFNNMQLQITLDQKIAERYRETMGILGNTQISLNERQKTAARFEAELRDYLKNLNPDAG